MKNLIVVLATLLLMLFFACIINLPLEVHVIKDVSLLFKVDFITDISKETLFGILLIIALIKTDATKTTSKDGKHKDDVIGGALSAIGKSLTVSLIILLFWGLAYVVHAVNF